MDGYKELTKSEAWRLLNVAKEAAFRLQEELRSSGREELAYLVFGARTSLGIVENGLRREFKQKGR